MTPNLQLSHDTTLAGYIDAPSPFISGAEVGDTSHDKWLLTGDAGRLLEDGRLELYDRICAIKGTGAPFSISTVETEVEGIDGVIWCVVFWNNVCEKAIAQIVLKGYFKITEKVGSNSLSISCFTLS